MRHANIWIGLSLLVLGALLAFAACSDSGDSDSDADGDGVGDACQEDADCASGQVCGIEGTCVACQPCQTRSDCDVEGGYTCDAERGCCKQIECSRDVDCEAPEYCIDSVCRAKPCTVNSDCRADSEVCLNEKCATRECTTHSDCASKLCDPSTYQCKSCESDIDCPFDNQLCISGVCKTDPTADGDSMGPLQGCTEYVEGCMFDVLDCFGKINPAEAYDSCVIQKDEYDNTVYRFDFGDGSWWKMFMSGTSVREWQAGGVGGFCYRITLDTMTGVFTYKTHDDTLLGYVRPDLNGEFLEITCPNGTKEWYDADELYVDDCRGYQRSGIYTPPPPGLEGCRVEE